MMGLAKFIASVLFLFSAVSAKKEIGDRDDGCPLGSYSYGTHCYGLNMLRGSYDEAELACEGSGGILAVVKDPGTHLFIQKLRIHKHLMNYWIGLNINQSERVWVYSDGSRLQRFNKWIPGSGEYNNVENCVLMWTLRSLLWDDRRCDERNLYICQFEARNCSTNAVRFGDYCFELSTERVTYQEADHACTAGGGILAAVKTQAMHEQLKIMIYSERWWKNISEEDVTQYYRDDEHGIINSWIGIRYDRGAWVYGDGTFVNPNFTKWAPGEPKTAKTAEDCVSGGQDWHDVTCNNVHPFICQYDRNSSRALPPRCPVYRATTKTPAAVSEDGCPLGSYSYGIHCYGLITLRGSYEEAELACEGGGGILAVVKDPETHLFIQKLRIRKHLMNFWIGLHLPEREHEWVYSDGSRLQGLNLWYPGSGVFNNARTCALMWTLRNLLWDGRRCDERNLYICQFEARNCSTNATCFGDDCFELSTERATFHEADNDCTARGGILAAVKTQAMHEQLKIMIFSERWWKNLSEEDVTEYYRDDEHGIINSWIGIRYDRGAWVYSDGTFVNPNFTKWAPGEPKTAKTAEDCVTGGQDWHDVTCNNVHPFICQYDRNSSQALPPRCPVYRATTKTPAAVAAIDSQSEKKTSSTARPRTTMPMEIYRATKKTPAVVAAIDSQSGKITSSTARPRTTMPTEIYRPTTKTLAAIEGKTELAFEIFGCFVLGAVCSMLVVGLVFYKRHFMRRDQSHVSRTESSAGL